MEWLNPVGAWAFLGVVPVIALYLLKTKAKRVPVPSLLLWRKTQERTRQSRPFEKLQNQLLLWLQLCMVALIALALMRPVTLGGSRAEAVLIFDLSASMQTVNEQGVSRLEEAKRQALELLDGMHEQDAVSVFAAGSALQQRVTRSADHALVRQAVEALEAENGGAGLSGAIALASAMQRDLPELQIYVYTDDASVRAENVNVMGVGQPMPNRSVLDMSIQPESGTAFARVAAWGMDGEAELECLADGVLCDVRTVYLTGGESQGVRFAIPNGAQRVEARFSAGDALAVDDARYAVSQTQQEKTALLITEGNVFLERALALGQGLKVVKASPADALAANGYDLYIYDGALPETLPETGAVLAVNPSSAVLDIQPGEEKSAGVSLRAGTGDQAAALCQILLLSDMAVKSYRPLAGGTPVLLNGGDALLSISNKAGRRAAALAFDLHESNLPLQADFPVLIQNLLAYLLPDTAAAVENAGCGESVAFALDARCVSAFVQTPSGKQAALEGSALEDTGEIGVYMLVETLEDGGRRETAFALHAPAAEYDTRQAAPPESDGQKRDAAGGWREWTVWLLTALFAVMLLEWGVSRRGTGI